MDTEKQNQQAWDRRPLGPSAFLFPGLSASLGPCSPMNSFSPGRLIPILVNGMKYSEIDIILLKVGQANCWVWASGRGVGLGALGVLSAVPGPTGGRGGG